MKKIIPPILEKDKYQAQNLTQGAEKHNNVNMKKYKGEANCTMGWCKKRHHPAYLFLIKSTLTKNSPESLSMKTLEARTKSKQWLRSQAADFFFFFIKSVEYIKKRRGAQPLVHNEYIKGD